MYNRMCFMCAYPDSRQRLTLSSFPRYLSTSCFKCSARSFSAFDNRLNQMSSKLINCRIWRQMTKMAVSQSRQEWTVHQSIRQTRSVRLKFLGQFVHVVLTLYSLALLSHSMLFSDTRQSTARSSLPVNVLYFLYHTYTVGLQMHRVFIYCADCVFQSI